MTAAERLARRAVLAMLGRMRRERLVVRDGTTVHEFGEFGVDGEVTLAPDVTIHDPRAWTALATGGSAGLGRAYFEGWWDSADPTAVVRVLIRNLDGLDRWRERAGAPVRALADPLRAVARRMDPERDRRNVRAHYDLGNDFFERLLDDTMMYSCAVFADRDMRLADAQRHKLDLICDRLRLGPDDHVLEIGTGWGGFAVHAARRTGCRVTTTTISAAQHGYAEKLVAETGLTEQITVLDQDFRDVTGTFDAIVSIEMIEAVDWRLHDTFFAACAQRLAPDGRMLLQAITVPDRRYERTKNTVDFIKAHVFPGGCLPSIGAIDASLGRATDLTVADLRDIGVHYVETLRRWRANLDVTADSLGELGLDRRFERLFRFYLCYCEAAFEERHVSDVQMLLVKPQWRDATIR